MSAEGKPPAEFSILARPLAWITGLATRFPAAIVALAVTAAIFSIVLSVNRLGFRTSRLDLLNPNCSHNQLWIDYIDEFGDQDDVVVVVEGADRQVVVPVLEEISSVLIQEEHLFQAVLHEVDLSTIRGKGLYYLPQAELRAIEPMLDELGPIVDGDWARLNLITMSDGLCFQLHDPQYAAQRPVILAKLDRLSKSLLASLAQESYYQSPWPEMPQSVAMLSELGPKYLLANEGRLGLVLLRLVIDKKAFASGTEAIDTLRGLIAQSQVKHPEVKIGLTGLPVMENDEMRSSQSAMTWASVLSLVGVTCLFVAGFGGLRHPMMAVVVLLLGMAWAFGYITLVIGHLNILSIAFAVILIGLGIDFGIHYVARYLQLRTATRQSDEALTRTASGVGPGVVTGAVTTSLAFFMAGFTDFTGVAELGWIAAGGILLCLVATVVVLPALIHLSDANRFHQILPVPLDIRGWLEPLVSRPLLTLTFSVAATAGLSVGISQVWYDHNLLNLQPDGIESVELERKLLTESDQSVWFALSIADSREELFARKEQFLKQPSVERVEEIASLLPVDHEQKRPIIERIGQRLVHLPERPPEIPVDPPAELGQALARAQVLVSNIPAAADIARQLEQARDALRRLTAEDCSERLRACQHGMASDLLSRLIKIRAMANPDPPKLTDLPEGLVTRFVGQNQNRYLMKIYSKANIWDMVAMKRFVHEVRQVDPNATGNPLQTYEASLQMKASYEHAAWYALGAILVVLMFDFGSARYTLLAMLPLGFGMLQMVGIMGLLDIPLNPANMIVLPLLLGIGVDDGVHVVHDFRCQRGPYRISPSTASAVLITSLTTMIGFGSLMIASHRGLQSLGRVLTIGVVTCLFASLVMLPAMLSWITRHRSPVADDIAERRTTPRHIHHRRDTDHRGIEQRGLDRLGRVPEKRSLHEP